MEEGRKNFVAVKTLNLVHNDEKSRKKGRIDHALMCGCAGGGTHEPFVQRESLTQPVALGGETTRFHSGVVRAAHEVSLGLKTAG